MPIKPLFKISLWGWQLYLFDHCANKCSPLPLPYPFFLGNYWYLWIKFSFHLFWFSLQEYYCSIANSSLSLYHIPHISLFFIFLFSPSFMFRFLNSLQSFYAIIFLFHNTYKEVFPIILKATKISQLCECFHMSTTIRMYLWTTTTMYFWSLKDNGDFLPSGGKGVDMKGN